MSLETIIWAFKQPIRPALTKFVLVALGDNANDESGLAYPSIPAICDKTSADRKTVISALDSLEKSGMISDTGKRVGATKQIKVYRLDGYLIDSGRMLINSSVFPTKECRISLVTVPETGHGTATEPQEEPQDKDSAEKGHTAFVKLWCAAYREVFEEKYAFQRGKDGNAAKQLLGASGKTPDELMEIARAAWANVGGFYSKSAASICGFNSKFNEIRQELNQKRNGTHQAPVTESRRNLGTANEGKSSQYRDVGRLRKLPNAQ